MKSLSAALLLLLCAFASNTLAESPQFRGPNRDGIFSATGLATSWPEGGPELLWSTLELGEGYASVALADGKIFTTGKKGETAIAFALDLNGKKKWSTEYGTEHSGAGYPGSRSTPTYHAGAIFLLSSNGEAVSIASDSGTLRWKVNVLERFGGENIYWGLSESPLIDGGRMIVTAGGKDAAVVALDVETGETVWTSKGLSDSASYCNPRIWKTGKHRQLVTMTAKHLVGLDPATGTVLWRAPVEAAYDIHANSPVFQGDLMIISHHVEGSQAFKLSADGRSVTSVWSQKKLDIHHGGAVLIEGRFYGGALKDDWYVLDAENGEVLASIPQLGKGSVVYADGRLYAYSESGEMRLINPDPESFEVISQFSVTAGEGQHWSHPVIVDQVLYLRHGSALMAFDIAKKVAKPKRTDG